MKIFALVSAVNCVQLNSSPFDGVAIQTALNQWPAVHDEDKLDYMENQMATYSNQGKYIKDGPGAAYQQSIQFGSQTDLVQLENRIN